MRSGSLDRSRASTAARNSTQNASFSSFGLGLGSNTSTRRKFGTPAVDPSTLAPGLYVNSAGGSLTTFCTQGSADQPAARRACVMHSCKAQQYVSGNNSSRTVMMTSGIERWAFGVGVQVSPVLLQFFRSYPIMISNNTAKRDVFGYLIGA
jgi:hypothetical protein